MLRRRDDEQICDDRRFLQSTGMAASDKNHSAHPPRAAGRPTHECLSAAALDERLDEEIARAERQGTALSCLLVSIDRVEQLAGEGSDGPHGAELPERALRYLGGALQRQLRRFDRVGRCSEGELLVVLPGADERRAEVVARRSLGRLHAVKLELDGMRHPLGVSIGIAGWRHGWSGAELLERVRLAARAGEDTAPPPQPS